MAYLNSPLVGGISSPKKKHQTLQGGPLLVINGVITLINGLIIG